ncbi:FHA domain-containing protein FhaB/FipA [Pseudarthrobacter sp. J1738]|uniref:FHA domain-containing protein FhaB/FipA n=1 Tax=unclassified Pseudarthrobacter TaxID=2647000 RepID=UPI003D2E23E0
MSELSDLTVAALRFGFLLLLWVLIFSIVSAMRRDLMIGGKARTGAPTAREIRKNPDLAPAPAPPVRQQARQLVVTEGPLTGTSLDLAASPILLGRAQEATLVLEDDYASGRHARLFPQGSRWFIEDLGSTNGTFLADQPLTRALPVELGVPVRIGKTVIELRP